MIPQLILYVKDEYFDGLEIKIQKEIDNQYPERYLLNIQYFNMQYSDDGECVAFLLFNPIPNNEL